jgi:hypothetical protein
MVRHHRLSVAILSHHTRKVLRNGLLEQWGLLY